MEKRLVLFIIFFAALAVYLPFNSNIPVTDPVESNYALTAKEMLVNNNWFSPQIYGEYWFDKPIMSYWLIILSYKIFGISEFAARFPAAIFSSASVAFAYWFANKIYDNRKAALLSALVLGTSLEFWVLARMIITDSVLFFFTSVAMAGYYLGLRKGQTIYYVLAYAAAGFAVLTKGPVGIVLPGIIIFAYIVVTRQWSLLHKLFIARGLLVFFAVAGPWYLMMYVVHGQNFVEGFLGLHNYVRATVSEHPKDNVFYYYLVLFPLSLLPWTGLLFKALAGSCKNRLSVNTYLTVWPAVTIIFYTMMATKYPTYVLPAMFPVALLIGDWLTVWQNTVQRKTWLWLSVPFTALLIIVAYGTKLLPAVSNWYVLYLVIAIAVIVILWLQIKGNPRLLPEVAAVVVIIISILLVGNGVVPLAQSRSAKLVIQHLPKQDATVASYGEYAASAVFYSGYIMPRLVTEHDSKESVWSGKYTMPTETISQFDFNTADKPSTYILVKAKDQSQFQKEAIAKHFTPVYNYANMTLYRRVIEK